MFKNYVKDFKDLKKTEMDFNTTHFIDNLIISCAKLAVSTFLYGCGKKVGDSIVIKADEWFEKNVKVSVEKDDLEEVEVVDEEKKECQ